MKSIPIPPPCGCGQAVCKTQMPALLMNAISSVGFLAPFVATAAGAYIVTSVANYLTNQHFKYAVYIGAGALAADYLFESNQELFCSYIKELPMIGGLCPVEVSGDSNPHTLDFKDAQI